VAPERISARGYGSSQPIADNATPEGQAQNRRVELRVIGGQ
jgi:outer membrane protein OmpA-like peptidoglycan-associated protein